MQKFGSRQILKSLFLPFLCGALFHIVGCGSQPHAAALSQAFVRDDQHLAAGACTGTDRSLYINKGNVAFSAKLDSCASGSWGDGPQTTQCLLTAFPRLTSGCASCFGNVVACGKSNCFWQCIGGSSSPGCNQCTQQQCYPALTQCTGVPVTDLPRRS